MTLAVKKKRSKQKERKVGELNKKEKGAEYRRREIEIKGKRKQRTENTKQKSEEKEILEQQYRS